MAWTLLVLWLSCWGILCALYGRYPDRMVFVQTRRHRLEFTGWTLVWQYRFPLYGPSLLPDHHRGVSNSKEAGRGRAHASRHQPFETAGTKGSSPGLARSFIRLVSSLHKIGFILGVGCFAIGQVALLLFLVVNLFFTVFTSTSLLPLPHHSPSATPPFHVAARCLLLPFLLPHHHGSKSFSLPQLLLRSAAPFSGLHVATFIKPVVPGLDYDATTLWLAVLIAILFHEMGHAAAAWLEGLQIRDFGVYLAVLIPGAYVTIDDRLKYLSPVSQLRVMCGGVWHNIILCIGLAMALSVLPLSASFYQQAPGAVIQSVPPTSAFARALKPTHIITHVQDRPCSNAASFRSILRDIQDVTSKRAEALKDQSRQDGNGPDATASLNEFSLPYSLSTISSRGSSTVVAASHGLLQPDALCTRHPMPPLLLPRTVNPSSRHHLPACCTIRALSGEEPGDGTSCFLLLDTTTSPLGKPADGPLLTCLPARELALEGHITTVTSAPSPSAGHEEPALPSPANLHEGGDPSTTPYCYYPVMLPPNALIKITSVRHRQAGSSSSVLVFEGPPAEVEQDLQVADYLPRPWLLAFLPPSLCMSLRPLLTSFTATLLDVSFSIAALNLLPMTPLDGGHASIHLLRLLLPPARCSSSSFHTVHRLVVRVSAFLGVTNLVFSLASMLEVPSSGGKSYVDK